MKSRIQELMEELRREHNLDRAGLQLLTFAIDALANNRARIEEMEVRPECDIIQEFDGHRVRPDMVFRGVDFSLTLRVRSGRTTEARRKGRGLQRGAQRRTSRSTAR